MVIVAAVFFVFVLNMFNTGDYHGDCCLMYSLQANGRHDYADEHNVWQRYMYCVIMLLLTSYCLHWKWSPTMIMSMLVCGISWNIFGTVSFSLKVLLLWSSCDLVIFLFSCQFSHWLPYAVKCTLLWPSRPQKSSLFLIDIICIAATIRKGVAWMIACLIVAIVAVTDRRDDRFLYSLQAISHGDRRCNVVAIVAAIVAATSRRGDCRDSCLMYSLHATGCGNDCRGNHLV